MIVFVGWGCRVTTVTPCLCDWLPHSPSPFPQSYFLSLFQYMTGSALPLGLCLCKPLCWGALVLRTHRIRTARLGTTHHWEPSGSAGESLAPEHGEECSSCVAGGCGGSGWKVGQALERRLIKWVYCRFP